MDAETAADHASLNWSIIFFLTHIARFFEQFFNFSSSFAFFEPRLNELNPRNMHCFSFFTSFSFQLVDQTVSSSKFSHHTLVQVTANAIYFWHFSNTLNAEKNICGIIFWLSAFFSSTKVYCTLMWMIFGYIVSKFVTHAFIIFFFWHTRQGRFFGVQYNDV